MQREVNAIAFCAFILSDNLEKKRYIELRPREKWVSSRVCRERKHVKPAFASCKSLCMPGQGAGGLELGGQLALQRGIHFTPNG